MTIGMNTKLTNFFRPRFIRLIVILFVSPLAFAKAQIILIFVHGGPGAVEMPFAWAFQRPWEDFFTVVQYDQRGAGRSYPLNDPKTLAPTLTIDRYREDTIELIELLR